MQMKGNRVGKGYGIPGLVLLMAGLSVLGACSNEIEEQASLIREASPAMSSEAVSADPLFSDPYIDIDEWRDTPVRHRYIHGGFKGTETRFSFYFPPSDQYEGRFFQHITPIPESENLAPKVPAGEYNKIGFSIDSGAYFIETNGGGHLDLSVPAGTRMDPTITAYRANAATARYSRLVAQQISTTPAIVPLATPMVVQVAAFAPLAQSRIQKAYGTGWRPT